MMYMNKFISEFLSIIADHTYYKIERDSFELTIIIYCYLYMEEETKDGLIELMKSIGIEIKRDSWGEYHFTLDSDGRLVTVELDITNSY